MMAMTEAPAKKALIKYVMDGGDLQTKELILDASLTQVRAQLQLSDDMVFLMDGTPMDKTEESEISLEEIIDDKKVFHMKTKQAKVKAPVQQRFPVVPGATLIDPNRWGLQIYQYPHVMMKNTPSKSHTKAIDPSKLVGAKCIIMVGQTGTGKSTTINSMVNYLMGVRREDNFRYELIVEPNRHQQSESQTTEPNIYCIEPNIDYPTVVIIDTPGYSNTEGLEKDFKIDYMIRQFFKVEVEMIHLVCFVVKAHMRR